jgi:uncharacterized protein (DUF4415 family)
MKQKSLTDWARVRAYKEGDPIPYDPEDGPYDPNDEAATEAYLSSCDVIYKGRVIRKGQRGLQKSPTKERITIRLSPEVVEHFRATGSGWQARINEVLQKSIRAKRKPAAASNRTKSRAR